MTDEEDFLTADLRTEFHISARPGTLRAEGHVVKRNRRVVFCGGELFRTESSSRAPAARRSCAARPDVSATSRPARRTADTDKAMDDDHAPSGLLIAALGAAVLAISVFQPWYGREHHAVGRGRRATPARGPGPAVREPQPSSRKRHAIETKFNSLAGHEITTVSAHQALKKDSLILLALAGIALLASLLRLAGRRGLLFATGSQIALLGGLAFADVFFRILWRPGAGGEHFVALLAAVGASSSRC